MLVSSMRRRHLAAAAQPRARRWPACIEPGRCSPTNCVPYSFVRRKMGDTRATPQPQDASRESVVPDRYKLCVYSVPIPSVATRAVTGTCSRRVRRLIGKARKAFRLAEHLKHVKNAGRGHPACQGRAQGLRHRAELEVFALHKRPHDAFDRLPGPWLDLRQVGEQFPANGADLGTTHPLALPVYPYTPP